MIRSRYYDQSQLKDAPAEDLTRAVDAVISGRRYLDPAVAAELHEDDAGRSQLTPRQVEILGLLADGTPNDEIAARLFLSPDTVRVHVKRAMANLGASTRTQAVAAAMRRGVIR